MRACAVLLVLALGAAGAPGSEYVPAEVHALRDVVVSAEVSGAVTRRPEKETGGVKAGDVVVTLDDTFFAAAHEAAKAALQEAEAQREWAELELKRAEQLVQDKTIGQAEYDKINVEARRARATAAILKARLVDADARLKKARIRAPFAGQLVRIYPEVGSYLQIGRPAFRLIDDSRLKIVVYARAELLPRLTVGREVTLLTDADGPSLPPLRGKVYSVAAAAEGKARTFRVEIRLEDKSGRWRPGMTGRLEFPGAAVR
jgi:RND family efflux transporter MFP subunit